MTFSLNEQLQKVIIRKKRKLIRNYVQGVPNSILIIGISETIKDTRSVKWWQSCAIWCLLKRRFEILKIPNTSEDFWKKPNIRDLIFIFL